MLKKVKVSSYIKILAEKHGIPEKNIKKILNFGLRNLVAMIKRGEDVNLMHFGSFYFDKKAYSKYIHIIRKSISTNPEKQKPDGKNHSNPRTIGDGEESQH